MSEDREPVTAGKFLNELYDQLTERTFHFDAIVSHCSLVYVFNCRRS